VLGLVVALLCLPSLLTGYQTDDWTHQAILNGVEPLETQRSPVNDLFSFIDGEPETVTAQRDAGIFPWWVQVDLKLRLWRPLTALTHLADHALAPNVAVIAHLHSIAWMVALALLAIALFRRVHGVTAVAGLAALVYCLDEARGLPVGWLANRNAMVAGSLGVAALLLHDRWRRDGWTPGAALAPLVFALALLAGEAAIAVTAYLFAHALFLDSGRLGRRLRPLAPYAGVVVAWRLVYRALGYGLHGSGVYRDPLISPHLYLATLPERIVEQLAAQLAGFPATATTFVGTPGRIALGLVALLLVLALGRAFVPLLRDSREARFWATGMVLSTLPTAATFPSARLLTFVGLGGAGLVAVFCARVWGDEPLPPGTPAPGPWTRRLAAALVVLHVVVAGLLLPVESYLGKVVADFWTNPCDRALPDGPEIEGRTAVFVNSNDLCAMVVLPRRAVEGRPAPERVRLLASAMYDIEIEGVDEHTLELRIPAGMHSTAVDALLRPASEPLAIGERVELTGVAFEALSHNADGHVDRVRVRFERELWDPSLVWIAWQDREAGTFVPPRPGEVVRVKRMF